MFTEQEAPLVMDRSAKRSNVRRQRDQKYWTLPKDERAACFSTCLTSGFLRGAARIACEVLPSDTTKLEELAEACEESRTCRAIVKLELRRWRSLSRREPWVFRLTMECWERTGMEPHLLLQKYPKTLMPYSGPGDTCLSLHEETRDCPEFDYHQEKPGDLYRASNWLALYGRRHALLNLVGTHPPRVVGWYLRNVFPHWRDISVDSTGTMNFFQAMFRHSSWKWIRGVVDEMLLLPGAAKLRESDFSRWTLEDRQPSNKGYAQRSLVSDVDKIVCCSGQAEMEKRIRWAAQGTSYVCHVLETIGGAPGPDDFSIAEDSVPCRALVNWRRARAIVKEHYRGKRMARLLVWRKALRGDRSIAFPGR